MGVEMILPDVGPGNKRRVGVQLWGKGVWVWASGRFLSWVGGGVWTPHSGHPHPGRLAGRPYWGSEQRGGSGRGQGASPTPGRPAGRPYRGMGQGGGRGRGWKVPDGCAGRRRRLYRWVLSATADVPHRSRLCDSPMLLRGRGGDARESRCGAVSTTRSARPP